MTTPAAKSMPMKVRGGKTVDVPVPGFGTFTLRDTADHPETIARAIKAGYRHLDCAWEYAISNLVGEGIKLSQVPREDLFIASKFSAQFARPENVEVCLDMELKALGTDYLDLFMAHHPAAFKTTGDITQATMNGEGTFEERSIAVDENSNFIPDLEYCPRRIAALNGSTKGSFLPTWRALKSLVRQGKIRAIGVSNFEIEDLQELMEDDDDIPVSCNQIETHPWFPNTALMGFMHAHSILAICYSPLATIRESYINGVYGSELCQPDGTSLIDEPVVASVAANLGLGRAQVLRSWAATKGAGNLGRTYTDERMAENLDTRILSADDMALLDGLEKRGTRGKSFVMSLCFPPIDFGDLPEDVVLKGTVKEAGAGAGADVKTVEVITAPVAEGIVV